MNYVGIESPLFKCSLILRIHFLHLESTNRAKLLNVQTACANMTQGSKLWKIGFTWQTADGFFFI